MKCSECNGKMKESNTHYKGLEFDGWECTKCGDKIFTEEQFMDVARKMQAARLAREYKRKAMKIGNSLAVTFPKDVVDAYDLDANSHFIIHTKPKTIEFEICETTPRTSHRQKP